MSDTTLICLSLVVGIAIGAFSSGFGQGIMERLGKIPASPTPEPPRIEAQSICLSNVHVFIAINVQPGPELSGPMKSTIVLKTCRLCGLNITPLHQGDWTISDFTAKEPSDLSKLEAIGRL